MKTGYDVIVIGGGVIGLGTAYRLARLGITDVLVLEKSFIGQGASARNAGGIRQQWGSPENIALSRMSLPLWRRLAAELEFNVLFREGGYLFLLYDEETLGVFAENVAVQNAAGIPSRLLSVSEARRLAPAVDFTGARRAAFCAEDGVAFHFPVIWAYDRAARRLGVTVRNQTEVKDVIVEGGRVTGVDTDSGRFRATRVLNAAGAWSSQVGRLAGVDLPTRPQRHEMLVTEALKPFVDPMVIDTRTGVHFYQTARGEVVVGAGHHVDLETPSHAGSLRFLEKAAGIVRLVPQLRSVRVMRQWAGCYDLTRDHKPILGAAEQVSGFYYACGFSGHGFMVSPAVTRAMARLIAGRPVPIDLEPFRPTRFAEGDYSKDPAVL